MHISNDIQSRVNSVANALSNTYEGITQPFTKIAGKASIYKINSEIQDLNVSKNGFQVSKILGNLFIPYGGTEATKSSNVRQVLNQLTTAR